MSHGLAMPERDFSRPPLRPPVPGDRAVPSGDEVRVSTPGPIMTELSALKRRRSFGWLAVVVAVLAAMVWLFPGNLPVFGAALVVLAVALPYLFGGQPVDPQHRSPR